MLLTFCSLMDTTKKHRLENHLQRLRTSSLHNIQMVIFFLKEHTVITNTICILFSPNRTFFQIWRISTKNHINLFTYKVKRGTNWDWGCNLSSKNKYLMTIICEKNYLESYQFTILHLFVNTRTIFVATSHIWFSLLSCCL